MFAHKYDYPVLIVAPDRTGRGNRQFMVVPVVTKAKAVYAKTRALAEAAADKINPRWREYGTKSPKELAEIKKQLAAA